MAAAVKSSSSAGMAGKKSRKPYVMTRPRERWTADEHGRFLHALLLFGRDWKSVQAVVATKTATQIRSHAQKHFLRAQKQQLVGFAAAPHPRSSAGAGPGYRQHRPLTGCPPALCAGDGASTCHFASENTI